MNKLFLVLCLTSLFSSFAFAEECDHPQGGDEKVSSAVANDNEINKKIAENGFWIAPGEGFGTAQMATFTVPEAQAKALLSHGLELVPSDDAPKGMATITVLAGPQFDVTDTKYGLNIPSPAYHEMLIAVNHVRRVGGSGEEYWYFHRVFVDKKEPLLMGWYYGYRKLPATYTLGTATHGMSYDLKNIFGNDVLNARFHKEENADPAALEKNFAHYKQLLEKPVISNLYNMDYSDESEKPDAHFECSKFVWDWDTAKIEAQSSEWNIGPDLAPGLANQTFVSKPVDKDPNGGFAMTVHWKVAGPVGCK